MDEKNKKHEESEEKRISRRDFLKILGAGTAGVAATALNSCTNKQFNTEDPTKDDYKKLVEPPKGKMTYRTNRKTGDKVSLLGYGMMRLPVEGGGTARESTAPIDQEMVNKLVDYAMDHGVNFFDTSPAYCKGNSEKATGIALHRHPRNSYFVSTKLSNFNETTWSAKASKEMFFNSLKDLQVDYVDYYLMHGCGMGGMENFENRYVKNGIMDWLIEQRKAGRIRNLGFSYHGDIKVFDHLLSLNDQDAKYHWDFVLIELNYLDWHYANEINPRNTDAEYLYNELSKRGIQMLVMEPLLGGRLSNVPQYVAAEMKQRDPAHTVASWAFRYAGSKEDVLCVLSGMTYMEHLKDNLMSYCPLRPITTDEDAFLMKIARELYDVKTIPCNDCKYCMPCPFGVDIPNIFVHYNKVKNEGHLPHSKDDDNYWQYRKEFLVGQDRSVPRLRQSDHCIGCGECKIHCPQNIDIPKELHGISDFVEKLKRA